MSEVVAIYSIAPATILGEHADQWAATGRANVWVSVPHVVESSPRAGLRAPCTGRWLETLTTTFTASQGCC